MSEIQANKLSPSSGTAITLGDSSDTFTIPSGVTLNVASGGTISNSGTATGFGGGDNTPAFIVGRTGGQLNVNNNTYTKLEFDNEILDTDSAFASNKFTVPSGEGGKYHFIAGCGTAPPGSGTRSGIAFYKNGSLVEHGRMRDSAGGTGNDSMLNAAVILNLSADDYIEVYVRHNKGSDLTYYDDNMFFAGYKLIGV